MPARGPDQLNGKGDFIPRGGKRGALSVELLNSVADGRLLPGRRLPSLGKVIGTLGLPVKAQPSTVLLAVEDLEGIGVLIRRGHDGTYVTDNEHLLHQFTQKRPSTLSPARGNKRSIPVPLFDPEAYKQWQLDMLASGHELTQNEVRSLGRAGDVAPLLGVSRKTPIRATRMVSSLDGRPFVATDARVPQSLIDKLGMDADIHIDEWRTQRNMFSQNADNPISIDLEIERGAPLIVDRAIHFDPDGTPVEVVDRLIPPHTIVVYEAKIL